MRCRAQAAGGEPPRRCSPSGCVLCAPMDGDECHHTAAPLHLIHLFLGLLCSRKYVLQLGLCIQQRRQQRQHQQQHAQFTTNEAAQYAVQ